MRYLVALYVLLAVAAMNLLGADRILEAKAALLLASAAPKAKATCPSCTGPGDCTCDSTKCDCPACAAKKAKKDACTSDPTKCPVKAFSAGKNAKKETCDCAGPGSCTCEPLECKCQNCIVKSYTWKECTDPDFVCLMADGKWVGSWCHSAQAYYARQGEGGLRTTCPTTPPVRRAVFVPVSYAAPVGFVGGRGCSGGS